MAVLFAFSGGEMNAKSLIITGNIQKKSPFYR